MKKTNALAIGLLFALTACVGQITNNVDADTKIDGTAKIDTKIDSNIDNKVKTGDINTSVGNTNNSTTFIRSVSSVNVSPSSISVKTGDSTQLAGTVKFNDGTTGGEIIWSSSNTSVAQVDSNGKVSGLSTGTTIVIATSKDDASKTSSVSVTVEVPVLSSPIPEVTPTSTPTVSSSPTITPAPTPTPSPTPLPTVTPTASPTPNPTNNIIYKDDFSNSDNWSVRASYPNNVCSGNFTIGSWKIVSGKYEGKSTKNCEQSETYLNQEISGDFSIKLDFNVINHLQYSGIFFLQESSTPGYLVQFIDRHNLTLYRFNAQTNVYTLLKSVDVGPINDGENHSYKIEVKGNNIKAYFDNSLKIDVSDNRPTSGKVGLRVTNGSHVAFDNLIIEKIN